VSSIFEIRDVHVPMADAQLPGSCRRKGPQAAPCRLPAHLLGQAKLRYSLEKWDLIAAARIALRCGNRRLEELADLPSEHAALSTPPVHRAALEVRKGAPKTTARGGSLRNAFADERRGWKRSAELDVFERAFQRFVDEWVVPQFGCDCLVSPATLRVVLPGGVRPSRPHCDADYGYDASEVNFWVPLTRVAGASSMWLESAPGRADFKPIDALPGHACRFYGSRCRHFTVENASDLVSVRFDFRVLPRHLACAELARLSPEELASEHRYTLHVWDAEACVGRATAVAAAAAPAPTALPNAADDERAATARLAAAVQSLLRCAAREVCPAAHLSLWDAASEGVRPSDAPAKGPDLICRAPSTLFALLRAEQARDDGGVRIVTISEYGVRRERSYGSARELAEAVLAHLPEEGGRRLLGDSRARDDGFLLLTSRLHWWRQSAVGHVQCTRCGGFFSGGRGLREHWLGKHGKAYEEAKAEVDAATSTALVARAPHFSEDEAALFASWTARAERRQRELAELPPAIAAARDGDIGTLRALVKGDFDPAVDTDRHGASAMLWAAGGGHLAVCELLHAHGASAAHVQPANANGRFGGRTALHWAARRGHLDVCRWLVAHGAAVDARTSDGSPPLHWAVWHAQLDVCVYLVDEAGADLHAVNAYGCNAIQWACQCQADDAAAALTVGRWLARRGLDVGVLNCNGHSAVHKAALHGNRPMCEWLLGDGGPLTAAEHMRPDKRDGSTPATLARSNGHEALGEWLDRVSIIT
jgi:hypothetical protein